MRLLRRKEARSGARPQWRPIPAWSWMLGAIIAVAVTAFVITTWLLAIAGHAKPGTDQANARLDAVRTGLAAGGGAGAAVGLMLAFRRQHHQEISTALTDYDAAQRRITELYSKSVEQLGSDKAPVRLGGLYALERLAQDNPNQRQTMVDVICAYLRMPFPAQAPGRATVPADGEGTARPGEASQANPYVANHEWEQEKQVRLTAQRVLADHLRRPGKGQGQADASLERFWDNVRLDLTGATLIDFDLTDGTVTDALFGGAFFSGGARFGGAIFSGGALFGGAFFSGGARFGGATFDGGALFSGATFSGGTRFGEATFKRGPDSITFVGALIRSSDNHHVWPEGWRPQDNGTGGLTVVRADGTTSL